MKGEAFTPRSGKLTPKQRVLKRWPLAHCYHRGYDKTRRCNWWQVWNPPGTPRQLLGMAKSPRGAWANAWSTRNDY